MRASLAILAVLGLAACQTEGLDQAQVLPADQAALPQTATLSITDPLVPGGAVAIGLTGGVPNARYTLVRSNGNIGAGGCPPFLGGECVDITPGTSGYIPTIDLRTDAAGNASFSGTLPTTVPVGINLSFQAVHVQSATGSNPLRRATSSGSCPGDSFDPADDTVAGGSAIANGLTTGRVACAGDSDFFTFTASAGQVLAASAIFDTTLGDVDLELLDSTGTVVASSIYSFTSPDPMEYVFTAGGTYAIRAFLDPTRTNSPLGIAYDIDFALVTPAACVDDAFFPNGDAFTNPAAIAPGTYTDLSLCAASDVDWFTIDLLTGDVIDINIFFSDDEGDVDLYLHAAPVANDTTSINTGYLGRGYSSSDDETVTYTAAADGTYYIGVRLFGEDGVAQIGNVYDLDIAVTPAP